MAICDDHPGLKAQIVVDATPLQEYDDEAGPNAISKYVEALSGKDFALKFTFTHPFPIQHGVEIRVSVDGEQSRVLSYEPEELYNPEGHFKRGVGFQKDGQWYRQNYRFTALNIVEEADGSSSVADLKKDLESKGSINISFRFITNMRLSERAFPRSQTEMLSVLSAIPEKALKGDARSHQATLGNPRRARSRKPRQHYDYADQEPFATFQFKYRSLAALKALQVIKDDEAEDVQRLEGPEDQMTPGQLREALRSSRRREEASRRVKQERGIARNIKREHAEAVDGADGDAEIMIVESRSRKRPRAALRALHIVPREPTPLPLEERPEEDLDADELRQVVRLLKERDAAALNIKKEAGSKRERPIDVDGEEGEVTIVQAKDRKRQRKEVIVLD